MQLYRYAINNNINKYLIIKIRLEVYLPHDTEINFETLEYSYSQFEK